MRGKNLKNLVKTIGALKIDIVPMVKEFAIVDSAHVCMMEIRAINGSPVFEVESESNVDLSLIQNIPDGEEFNVSVDDNKWILSNDDYRYTFNLVYEGYNKPKVPKIQNLYTVTIPSKKIQDAVKVTKGMADYLTFESDGEDLVVSCSTDSTNVERILGDCPEHFRASFPFENIERISKVLVGDVTMELDTDYPTIWTWNDGCYEYRYLLAPRIER